MSIQGCNNYSLTEQSYLQGQFSLRKLRTSSILISVLSWFAAELQIGFMRGVKFSLFISTQRSFT